jgi:cytochrome d ubiquinol oxidase subunit II
VGDPLWRGSWDIVFSAASTLLPVFFGAALGNLLRGVPLSPEGWFTLTLFTDFSGHEPVGILDWYTVLVGLFALAVLAGHGGAYLAWKTDGRVQERSRAAARRLFTAVAVLWPLVTVATLRVNPRFFDALTSRPLAWILGLLALAGLVAALASLSRRQDLAAFLGSCAFAAGLSGATAACAFPVLLRATGSDALSLTALNAGGDPAGLRTALVWFSVGLPLAIAYFVAILRLHRGKAIPAREGEGY